MVVAQFRSERRFGNLRTSVLDLLLRDEVGDNRAGANPHVLRLHCTDGPHVLATHWDNRLLRRVRIYQKDIRSCQDRLVKINDNSLSNV